ncbi:hypothetical protein S245_055546, partial [Arachis hypogaea]
EKVWTRFPPEGSKYTPPYPSAEFKWKDYCPAVFRSTLLICCCHKVDLADYMLSICGNEALRELCSPEKSGSFFYLTNDDRYMIKTMKKAEVKDVLFVLAMMINSSSFSMSQASSMSDFEIFLSAMPYPAVSSQLLNIKLTFAVTVYCIFPLFCGSQGFDRYLTVRSNGGLNQMQTGVSDCLLSCKVLIEEREAHLKAR